MHQRSAFHDQIQIMLDLDHDDAAKSNEESLEIWILELNLRTRVEFCIIFTY